MHRKTSIFEVEVRKNLRCGCEQITDGTRYQGESSYSQHCTTSFSNEIPDSGSGLFHEYSFVVFLIRFTRTTW